MTNPPKIPDGSTRDMSAALLNTEQSSVRAQEGSCATIALTTISEGNLSAHGGGKAIHVSTLRPPVKACLRDPATRRSVANWYRSARNLLGLTREQIAVLIGCSPRAYYAWEVGETAAPTDAYFAVRALLEERGYDSQRRIKVG